MVWDSSKSMLKAPLHPQTHIPPLPHARVLSCVDTSCLSNITEPDHLWSSETKPQHLLSLFIVTQST